MTGLFEDMALFDEGHRVARRQAAAVAQKRIDDRVGGFLKRAGDDRSEYEARLDLVQEDIRQIVADVAEEYDADVERLQDAIDDHLKGDGVTDLNGDLENAPSAVGSKSSSHDSDCSCGFCKNKGNLPGSKKDDDDDSSDDSDKSDSSDDDSKDDDSSDKDDKPDFLDKDSSARVAGLEYDLDGFIWATVGGEKMGPFNSEQEAIAATQEAGAEQLGQHADPNVNPAEQPPGYDPRIGAAHVADAPRDGGGALKTEKLPTGDSSALGGPSPKIDKKEWKPNALNENGNLKPIDTEMDGSPHPTEDQDVDDTADHSNDFLEQTEAVTDQQNLPTADESGQSTERNLSQEGQSDTWHTNEGQVEPVTSSTDPDVNPLKAILESGFATNDQVESAIAEFESQ